LQNTLVFSARAFLIVFAVAVVAILVGLVFWNAQRISDYGLDRYWCRTFAYFLYVLKSGHSPLAAAIALFWLVILEPAPCDILAGLGALAWFVRCVAVKEFL